MSARRPRPFACMLRARRRCLCACVLLAAAAALAACGKSSPRSTSAAALEPVAKQGAVSVVTRNTSRIGGTEAPADAAAVARAVYPGLTPATRPHAVALVDSRDWSAALSASVLAGAAIGAPILYSTGASLPEVTREALQALHPQGLSSLGGTQVIRLGRAPRPPGGLSTRTVPADAPAATAASVEELLREASGGAPPSAVIIVPSSAPKAIAMPAAGLAAESGAPILFTEASAVPPATLHVLGSLHSPGIFVVDPSVLDAATTSELSHFGRLTSLGPAGASTGTAAAVANAVALARFTNGSFGWGIKEPGHGLVFANEARPLDAPAAALLSANADYGPLLLLEGAHGIPAALSTYLSDIQPAYTSQPAYRPVRGVYNHGWLIGGEEAISAVTQAELDTLLEISPSTQNGEEAQSEQIG